MRLNTNCTRKTFSSCQIKCLDRTAINMTTTTKKRTHTHTFRGSYQFFYINQIRSEYLSTVTICNLFFRVEIIVRKWFVMLTKFPKIIIRPSQISDVLGTGNYTNFFFFSFFLLLLLLLVFFFFLCFVREPMMIHSTW